MNRQLPERHENIADWLSLATKDLCAPATDRITAEITAHYQEAVESQMAEGESSEKAKAQALDELGDPKESAERKDGLGNWPTGFQSNERRVIPHAISATLESFSSCVPARVGYLHRPLWLR